MQLTFLFIHRNKIKGWFQLPSSLVFCQEAQKRKRKIHHSFIIYNSQSVCSIEKVIGFSSFFPYSYFKMVFFSSKLSVICFSPIYFYYKWSQSWYICTTKSYFFFCIFWRVFEIFPKNQKRALAAVKIVIRIDEKLWSILNKQNFYNVFFKPENSCKFYSTKNQDFAMPPPKKGKNFNKLGITKIFKGERELFLTLVGTVTCRSKLKRGPFLLICIP